VTAIDYHFHDAHPTLPIGPGRDLIVRNQGRNLHNVTIPALGISRDVRPGGQAVIRSIADRLPPGRYELFCQIHLAAFGMKGVIVIASE
jgi:plastocyanin